MSNGTRRYELLAIVALVAACTSFTGSDATPAAPSVDAGELPADGGVHGGSSDGGNGGVQGTDSGKHDGLDATVSFGKSYCANPPAGTRFCADFDEGSGFDAGFSKQGVSMGTITEVNTFAGGSSPSGLAMAVNGSSATATAETIPILLSTVTSPTLVLELTFTAVPDASEPLRLVYLDFANEAIPVAIDGGSVLQCGATTALISLSTPHRLNITIHVSNGMATTYDCILDGTTWSTKNAIAPNVPSFAAMLGPAANNKPGTVTFDNVVIHAP